MAVGESSSWGDAEAFLRVASRVRGRERRRVWWKLERRERVRAADFEIDNIVLDVSWFVRDQVAFMVWSKLNGSQRAVIGKMVDGRMVQKSRFDCC